MLGVRRAALTSTVFTIGKLIPLLLLVGVGVLFIEPDRYSFSTPPEYGSFSQAVFVIVFAFMGFEVGGIPAGETNEPRRHLPFALLTAIGVVATLYVLIQLVCIGTLPGLAESERPLADAASAVLGPIAASVIAAGALVSVTGTLSVVVLTTPRLLFAMAERGDLPRQLAVTHTRYHTPHIAILLSAAAILLFTLNSTFLTAVTISTISRLLTFGTACLAVPVLRRRTDVPPATFVLRGGMAIPAAAVLLTLWLLSNSTWHEALAVAGAATLGVVLYLVFRHRGAALPEEREEPLGS